MLAEPLRTRRKGRDGVAVETGEQASMFTSVESASVLCYVKLTHIAAGIGWLAPTRLLVSAHAIAHLHAALILFHFLKSSEIWIIELTNTKTPLSATHTHTHTLFPSVALLELDLFRNWWTLQHWHSYWIKLKHLNTVLSYLELLYSWNIYFFLFVLLINVKQL